MKYIYGYAINGTIEIEAKSEEDANKIADEMIPQELVSNSKIAIARVKGPIDIIK